MNYLISSETKCFSPPPPGVDYSLLHVLFIVSMNQFRNILCNFIPKRQTLDSSFMLAENGWHFGKRILHVLVIDVKKITSNYSVT